jgi:hypothetical protein
MFTVTFYYRLCKPLDCLSFGVDAVNALCGTTHSAAIGASGTAITIRALTQQGRFELFQAH